MKAKLGLKPEFENADYWFNADNDKHIDDYNEAVMLAKRGDSISGVHSKLLLSDIYGVNIPKDFCHNFKLKEFGLSQNDPDVEICLAGPDEEFYWDAWSNILSKAKYTDEYGCEWYLEQDGDLFLFHNAEYKFLKQNPSRNLEIDQALVRDLYLTLDNESDFYRDYLLPLYKASEKYYRKGQYDSESFINSLQKRINDYTIHGPYHFSYNRKFFDMIPKKEREAVARMFEDYFIAELESGNGWLGSIKNNPIQVNFNNYRDQLTEDDIEQIVVLLCQRCRPDKYARLRSVLNYHPLSIPHLSILERLIKENGKWRYIAGQDYSREIKTVREIMLGE